MNAALAVAVIGAAVALVMCALAILGLVRQRAYRDGKVDEAIDRLSRISERHDDQIRELQRTRR